MKDLGLREPPGQSPEAAPEHSDDA
jgi:hypothetical protein